MTQSTLPRIRYASDMPFAVGMVLADEVGATTEVRAVDGVNIVLAGFHWHPKGTIRVSHRIVRHVYPHLVFVTELVAAAEAIEAERVEAEEEREWQEQQETLRVGALAQWAQHEDDLKVAILDRAEAERQRKNSRLGRLEALLGPDQDLPAYASIVSHR